MAAPYIYYQDDDITLWCGDNRDVLPLLPDKSVDLVLTDPHFNARVKYGAGLNDNRPWSEWCDEMDAFLDHAERISRGMVLVFTSVPGMIHLVQRRPPRWMASWSKPVGQGHQAGNSGFMARWEPCLVYGQTWGEGGRVPPFSLPDNWHTLPANAQGTGHPCPKPIELMRLILGRHPAAVVLDPYAGRGTTLRAAKDLGRKAIGIEMNPAYCRLTVDGLAQQVLPLAV